MVFDPISLLIQVAIAIAINIVAYVLMPKPKGPKPDAVAQMDNPVAEAGKPVPVPFGTVWMKEPNIIWYGDKRSNTYQVAA